MNLRGLRLAELIELREQLSKALVRRFERTLAMAFSDIVGSTTYFARFGDEAGHALQRRHIDLLDAVVPRHGGRIVDTAGDGAFTCFPDAEAAVSALTEVLRALELQNRSRAPEHHLEIRCGVHVGPVLTDGATVAGDAVNLAARVTSTARPRELRLSRAAADQLGAGRRPSLRPIGVEQLKGIPRPVELLALEWREQTLPTAVLFEETGERVRLPDQPTITFGRLRDLDGKRANDIVLWVNDRAGQMRISRWHFELRRLGEALLLHPVSGQATTVDGVAVEKGASVPVHVGSVIQLADGVLTLRLVLDDDARDTGGRDGFGGTTLA